MSEVRIQERFTEQMFTVHSFSTSDPCTSCTFLSFLFHCGKDTTNTTETKVRAKVGEMNCHNSVWVKTRFCYDWELQKHASAWSDLYSHRDEGLKWVDALSLCRIASHGLISFHGCIIYFFISHLFFSFCFTQASGHTSFCLSFLSCLRRVGRNRAELKRRANRVGKTNDLRMRCWSNVTLMSDANAFHSHTDQI